LILPPTSRKSLFITLTLLLRQLPAKSEASAPSATDAAKKPQPKKITEDEAPATETAAAATGLLAREEELKASKVTAL
jgi:hypothetical protein